MNLQTLIKISRPRFWLYAVGTFWVGAIAGAHSISQILTLNSLLYLVYFAFFANVYIYGINDLYDEDTDQFNAKKEDKEHRLRITERKLLSFWVILSLVIGLVFAWFAPNKVTQFSWLVFLFLAGAYSAKPFRFKAKPFIDAASNIHYAVIGFLAYAMFSAQIPPLWAIVAAWCWTASMHIFSAVPDIAADAKAKLVTTAVLLGKNRALIFCSLLWLGTVAALWSGKFFQPWSLITLVYAVVPLTLINATEEKISKIYWYFPIINGVLGFVLFWVLAIPKL